jgi:hypothetical protein
MSILKSKHSGWTHECKRTPFGGGKGGSPPPPDYAAAARQTAQGNLEATRAAAAANRVNQYTPYGSLIYRQEAPTQQFSESAYNQSVQNYNQARKAWEEAGSVGDAPVAPVYKDFLTTQGTPDDNWSVTQTLSPEQQKLLDYQNATSMGLGELTGTGLDYVKGMLKDPFSTQNLADIGFDPGQSYQDAYMERLRPQIEQSREAFDVRMANQGIPVGSEAYNRAMMSQGQKENDLLLGATTQGFGTGLQARQQGFNEAAYQRNEPLNTLNAVRTGAQVTNPSYVNVPQQATAQGADLLGAAQMQGNAAQAAANASNASSSNLTSGLLGLGGAAMMAF